MASKRPFSEEDFTCPVCCDVFKEPVLLSCGHSVCRSCVHRYWDTKGCQECPLCRKRSEISPTINLALKNLCQTFLEVREDPETLCDIHRKKLKLFCVTDRHAACLECKDSNKHSQHCFIPVDEAVTELKSFEKTLAKADYKGSDLKVASGEVINVAMYVGNLQFKLWSKMQSIIEYTPVVLDPNTAHPQLVLSADLTSVRDSDDDCEAKANKPSPPVLYTPGWFKSLCVLGSEGFSSGLHCWDVDVGSNTFWMLGVTSETVQQKNPSVFPRGAWGIRYDGQKLCARSPLEMYTPLTLAVKPRVVRIRLDMDLNEVWFLDPASNVIIYMFSHHFTEKVFPFFHSMCSHSPLKIIPLQHLVVLGDIP
ncbi:zinc-binding protein A33-like isoform X5 [Silurus meridionalis]|uniref:zinc-binding protein A33-like isoform X5 n=1 Tax=Silurus meridionalis TaxID=175797 RepID=UPI001EEB39C4|nr:zinc-binding protein A33-like isoform X5 [Silurus meridionalis]